MANVIHIFETFSFDTGDVLDNTQPHVALSMKYCSVC